MPNETVEQAEPAAPAPEEVVESTTEVTAQAEAAGDLDSLSLEDIQDLSADEADAFLYKGQALEVPDKAEPEPKPEEVETTPAAEVTETVEAETPVEEVPEPNLPKHIPLKVFGDEDQRVLRIMRAANEGLKAGDPGYIGITQAVAMLAKQDGKTEPVATPEPEPSPVETISAEVTALETNLKTLRQQKREAIEAGENTADIEEQIDDARDALAEGRANFAYEQREAARQQAEQAATKAQTVAEKRKESHAAVVTDFPDFAKAGSPLNIAADQYIAELKANPNHPDNEDYKFGLLRSAHAPDLVKEEAIRRVAKVEGKSYADTVSKYAAKAATPAPKAAPVTPKPATPVARKVLPAVGSQTTTPPKSAPTAKDVYDAVKDDGDGDSAWEAIYGNKPLNLLRPY